MKLKRIAVCLCALPMLAASSGCHQAAAYIISSPAVQQAALQAGGRIAEKLIDKYGDRILDAVFPSAEAGTLKGAPPALGPLAEIGPSDPGVNGGKPLTQTQEVAMVASRGVALKKDDGGVVNADGTFTCNTGETPDACSGRLVALLEDKGRERAEAFASAFVPCQDVAAHSDAISVPATVDVLTQCIADRGFQKEIAMLMSHDVLNVEHA